MCLYVEGEDLTRQFIVTDFRGFTATSCQVRLPGVPEIVGGVSLTIGRSQRRCGQRQGGAVTDQCSRGLAEKTAGS